MAAILADNDIEGSLAVLIRIWLSDEWRDLWTPLNCSLESFASLELPRDASDLIIWLTCQRHQVVLITGNRNARGPDSLEATLRQHNQPDSLPVCTLADPKRVLKDKVYAERTAERLLDYLMNVENYRGTGRLFVP